MEGESPTLRIFHFYESMNAISYANTDGIRDPVEKVLSENKTKTLLFQLQFMSSMINWIR